jgi:hypothetical protein
MAYGECFRDGNFVEKDEKVFVEWLEKAANQNNPRAMDWLGDWFRRQADDNDKAVSYYRAAAELGWKRSMELLAFMLRFGDGCVKDLSQAAIWSAKGFNSRVFWDVLGEAKSALDNRADLDCDFNQLCYALGWGLYWYQNDREKWNQRIDKMKIKDFGERCLDFYCSCVELQQKSIFTFLLFWNRTTGIKGPGQMIAQMVWDEREDTLLKELEARSE